MAQELMRFFPDGSPDFSFNPPGGATISLSSPPPDPAEILSISLQQDEKILIAGDFKNFNGEEKIGLVRLESNGELDDTFVPSMQISEKAIIVEQSPGHLILVDNFITFDGGLTAGILRLNDDGQPDDSFSTGTFLLSEFGQLSAADINEMVILPDSSILVGGAFTDFNGRSVDGLIKLLTNGQIDETFLTVNTGLGGFIFPYPIIYSIALQADGKILIAGAFTSYNDVEKNYIARLNPDGTLDNSFDPGQGPASILFVEIRDIVVQENGKIIAAGLFEQFDGFERLNITRLNSDGSVDPSFNPGTGTGLNLFGSAINAMVLQPDGKALIGSWFREYSGATRNRLARINSDGSLDESFDPGAGLDDGRLIYDILLQPNGRLLFGGQFPTYAKIRRNNLARVFVSTPFTPVNVQVLDIEENSFRLTWDPVASDITQYEVDISDDGFLNIIPEFNSLLVKESQLIVEGLEPGRIYACRVRAVNEQGASPNSRVIQVIIAPKVPSGLTARAIDQNQIILNWDFDGDPSVLYTLQFGQGEPDENTLQNLVSITGNDYTHTGLTPQSAYFYRIFATKNGVPSLPSELVAVITSPGIVTQVLPEPHNFIKIYPNPSQEQIRIDWTNLNFIPNQIHILNSSGEEMQQQKMLNQTDLIQVNIKKLPKGTYFIRLRRGDTYITKRFIKN